MRVLNTRGVFFKDLSKKFLAEQLTSILAKKSEPGPSGSSAPLPSQKDEDGMPQLRDPTAEEQEVIEAIPRLRNAKKQDETEVQGWKIYLTVREGGQKDITAVPPGSKKKLRSVPEVKRHMGILK